MKILLNKINWDRIMKLLKTLFPILLIGMLPLNVLGRSTRQSDTLKVTMTGNDQLKFSVTNIDAHPGQVVKVKLTTESDYPKSAMAHDFVLLTQNADAQKVAQNCVKYHDNGYIDPDLKKYIIAHTALAGDGETVSVTFKVPGQTGNYEYICTFPGHFLAGMKGTLHVKKNI